MDFNLSEEQEILKRSARDFLKQESPMKLVRDIVYNEKGYSPQLWRKMAALGWQGFILPSEYGGEDGSFLDVVILLEEMGYALLPGPFISTVILGGLSLLEAGSEEQKNKYLPKIASGELVFTLAVSELGTGYEGDPVNINVPAASHQDGFIITGTKILVPYAHVADYLICIVRTESKSKGSEGVTSFIVDTKTPGITITPLNTIGQDGQCEVKFENVVVGKQDILGQLNSGWPGIENAMQNATVALCAYINGAIQRILEITVDYSKERVQFGRHLGSFQVLQHHMVDISVALEASRFITYEAAWKISQGIRCPMEVSIAKSWASESYRQATWDSMKVQGGVACSIDHDFALFYRHAKAAEVMFGDADIHKEIIANQLLI